MFTNKKVCFDTADIQRLKIENGVHFITGNTKSRKFDRILFLDRDGVINIDFGYVYEKQKFNFVPGIFSFCKKAIDRGYVICVVTNQSGIARGFYGLKEFFLITRFMLSVFQFNQIPIWRIYFSPFHDSAGSKSVKKFIRNENTRKPGHLMFLHALKSTQANKFKCIVLGDNITDLQAAKRSNIPNRYLLDKTYDFGSIRL